MCFIAWPSPTVVVVLPSPSGVGVIAVTTTYFAFGRSASSSIASRRILATLDAVRLEQVLADAHLRRDLGQRLGGRGAGDLEVGWEGHARHARRLISSRPSGRGPSSSPRPAERVSHIAIVPRSGSVPRCGTSSGLAPGPREYSRGVPRRHRYVPYSGSPSPSSATTGSCGRPRWDEALGRAADGFRAIRDTHGGQRDRVLLVLEVDQRDELHRPEVRPGGDRHQQHRLLQPHLTRSLRGRSGHSVRSRRRHLVVRGDRGHRRHRDVGLERP